MNSEDLEWSAFFRRWYWEMVRLARRLGADQDDAEDAASAVALCLRRSWSLWAQTADDSTKYAYLRKAVKNELSRIRRRQAARSAREVHWANDAYRKIPEEGHDFEAVLQYLAIFPPRQRELLTWLYLQRLAGWRIEDVAEALGIRPGTVRRHRQNARRILVPYLHDDHHRALRAGERLHEDFHRGQASSLTPRPIILDAWKLARARGLDPGRGTRVALVGANELDHRRARVPVPVLGELLDVAERNGLLAVVLDHDSVVLHRGGHRDAVAAADRLGYLDGARWDLDHAGVNAVGLAGSLGKPVTVNRWEHSQVDQHRLCCAGFPIRHPHGGHVTLNLTTTTDAVTSVPRAVQRDLHAMALRLHRRLWTPTTTR